MKILTSLPPVRTALGLAWLLVATSSGAVTVHTWVDADGVRHFADAPPSDATSQPSQEISIDSGAAPVPEDLDYYSITNQWQRLRAEREAQDALDLERRRIDSSQVQPPPPMQDDVPRSVFYPDYYYGLPPRGGPMFPPGEPERGRPSPRNAFVNTPPPVWPRER